MSTAQKNEILSRKVIGSPRSDLLESIQQVDNLRQNIYKHFHGIYKRYTVSIMNTMEMFVPVLTQIVQLLNGF